MNRDWKQISTKAMDHDSVLLSDPSFDFDTTPDGAVVVPLPGLATSVPPTEFSARSVRRFLWDNRKDRAVTRDRAVIQVERGGEETIIRLGALTHRDAADRLDENHAN